MPDPEVLRGLRKEAHQALERQMSTGEDLDNKASDLLRFNALLIGIVLSAIALTLRTNVALPMVPAAVPLLAAGGLFFIGTSTLFALLAYEVTQYGIGLRARSLRRILEDDPGTTEFEDQLVHTYANILEGNRRPLDQTAGRLKWALWTLLTGLVFLGSAAGGFMYLAI